VAEEALVEEMVADISCEGRKKKKLVEEREKLVVVVFVADEVINWRRRLYCSRSRWF